MEKVLTEVFHLKAFRGKQKEIITEVLNKQDVFVNMPTGFGKSLVYNLAAVMLPGFAVIVSPILALMRDQVAHLQKLGIRAACWNSEINNEDKYVLGAELQSKDCKIKILLTSPESLASTSLMAIVDEAYKNKMVSFFAIDESHCITEWGCGFRPEYATLCKIRIRLSR